MANKNKMKKIFYIGAKCLKVGTSFFINYTFDEMNAWLVKNKYDPIDEKWSKSSEGLCITQEFDDGNLYFIWLPEFTLCREKISILVHELHHIVEAQSEEKEFDCSETKAYLIQYYLNEFLKVYKFN